MIKRFTKEEEKAWLEQQPKKTISAKVVIIDSAGQVLALKSSYKDRWDFPGGVVDANESPLHAAVRETHEEIGIKLEPTRLACIGVRYGYSKSKSMDYLHLLFKVVLDDKEVHAIKLDNHEVTDSKWIQPDDITKHVTGHFGLLAQQLVAGTNPAIYSDQDEIFV